MLIPLLGVSVDVKRIKQIKRILNIRLRIAGIIRTIDVAQIFQGVVRLTQLIRQLSKRGGVRSTVAGKEALAERENLTMPNLSASVGAASLHPRVGRRLRSRDRT